MAKTPRTYRFDDETIAALARLKTARRLNETALMQAIIQEADERMLIVSSMSISPDKIKSFYENLNALMEIVVFKNTQEEKGKSK